MSKVKTAFSCDFFIRGGAKVELEMLVYGCKRRLGRLAQQKFAEYCSKQGVFREICLDNSIILFPAISILCALDKINENRGTL